MILYAPYDVAGHEQNHQMETLPTNSTLPLPQPYAHLSREQEPPLDPEENKSEPKPRPRRNLGPMSLPAAMKNAQKLVHNTLILILNADPESLMPNLRPVQAQMQNEGKIARLRHIVEGIYKGTRKTETLKEIYKDEELRPYLKRICQLEGENVRNRLHYHIPIKNMGLYEEALNRLANA